MDRPQNDSCETALEIPTIPFSLLGDSSGAFTDFSTQTCSVSPANRGIWYKFTAPNDKILEVRINGDATFNTKLVVFTGSCALLSCLLNNNASGSGAFLSWAGSANTEYILLVTGVSGFNDAGTFTLSVSVSQISLWWLHSLQ